MPRGKSKNAIIGHDERGDLTIAHVNMGFGSESLQATALMTSAPALYEALKGAKELIDHIFSGKRVVRAHDRQIVARYARLTSADRACKRRNKLALKSAD